MIEQLNSLDKSLLYFINKGLSNPILDQIMPFITNQNNWLIPFIVLSFILLFKTGTRGKIAFTLLLLGFALTDFSASQYLKPFFGRLRPSYTLISEINLLVNKGGKLSLPSNHAANSFMIATIVGYFFSNYKVPLYIWASIISFSRIYVGVHYPGDIIMGALYGYSIAWIVLSLWVILKMRELKRGHTWVWYADESKNNNL